MSALILSLIAALGYGVSDFVGGLAARRTVVLGVVLVSYPIGFAGLLAIAPFAGGTIATQCLLLGRRTDERRVAVDVTAGSGPAAGRRHPVG